jgi:hypothetical protein
VIYLVTYYKNSVALQAHRPPKSLIFIESRDLKLEKVIALLKELTADDLDESSVEIIANKDWDPATINSPGVRFYKLD